MEKGRIVKSLSGFYDVSNEKGVFQCKGRGNFRKRKITPLVGDFVSFALNENNEGYITEVASRTNELIRPPIANVDQVIIVNAAKQPEFNPKLLDQFLILVGSQHIKPIIFVTKMDLVTENDRAAMKKYQVIYEKIGYDFKFISNQDQDEDEVNDLLSFFPHRTTVIAGQSGVGKSTILNKFSPSLKLKTDDISRSLGRGKHTTRHVELIKLNGGLVADTPGFSSLDFSHIEQTDLSACFPEMKKLENQCKYRGCLHDSEPNCAIKLAVSQEEIAEHRYVHYLEFLQTIQSRKPRY